MLFLLALTQIVIVKDFSIKSEFCSATLQSLIVKFSCVCSFTDFIESAYGILIDLFFIEYERFKQSVVLCYS